MKDRLHHIAITNFKAFREFPHKLEVRHLLVYGANGAGKFSNDNREAMHSILHNVGVAKCLTTWEEMRGTDRARTCGQSGVRIFDFSK
jgi:ABC-type thiamine transport system ATPase subunit